MKFQGFPYPEAQKQLDFIKSLDDLEFSKWKFNKRWDIVKFHLEKNPFYRDLLKGNMVENWESLPIVTKAMIQKPLAEIMTPSINPKNCYRSNTSGSSGIPLFFAKDKFSHAMTWAVIGDRYHWHQISLNNKQARFYGIPLNTIPYLKERLKDKIMNRYRFAVFNMSDEILEKYLNKFRREKFDYVYGYTNSLMLFAKYLVKRNIVLKDICPGLRICIATAEQCNDEDKLYLENSFGVKVVKEYGVSESDFIAINDIDGRWSISNELIHIEVVDENYHPVEDGKVGKIIITSLHNKAMPFIRYEVGDMGSIRKNYNGRYDELLTLNGRLNDIAYLPSGKTVPGFTLYYVSRQILEKSGIVREYTIKQTSVDHFIFEVVTEKPLLNKDIRLIKDTMTQYLEDGIEIEIKRVDKIERDSSGKLKHFYSFLNKI